MYICALLHEQSKNPPKGSPSLQRPLFAHLGEDSTGETIHSRVKDLVLDPAPNLTWNMPMGKLLPL